MPTMNLWIRDPYPFRSDEREAIQEALRQSHGCLSLVYLREYPVDYVSIDNTKITTAREVAKTLKTIHRQWAIQDRTNGKSYCNNLEIDIRGIADGRPSWAK